MKNSVKKFIALVLIFRMFSIATAQDSSIVPTYQYLTNPVKAATIQPYQYLGDTAWYVWVTGVCTDAATYATISYALINDQNKIIYSGVYMVSPARLSYLFYTCNTPACRIPYIYWLLITQNSINLQKN